MPRAATTVVHPATGDRWSDLERLFGKNGAYSNCWCTFWILKRDEYGSFAPEAKKAVLHDLVREGRAPGLLAYRDGAPVGWVAIQPRAAYPPLSRSPRGRAVPGDEGVWSVTCFLIHRDHRRTGLSVRLLEEAVAHAQRHGARVVEGYPATTRGALTGSSGYMGLVPVFERAGFQEVARPAKGWRVMRRAVGLSRHERADGKHANR